MLTVTVRIPFEAAHRLPAHEGRCRFLHGHSFMAVLTLTAARTNDMGMLVDFGVVKDKVGGWIRDNWDHNCILHPLDPLMELSEIDKEMVFAGKRPFLLPYVPPTAENLALFLHNVAANDLAGLGVMVIKTEVWETPQCGASYSGG